MYIIMQVYSYAYDVYVYYHTDSHTLITWPSSHPTLTPPKQRHLTYLNLALMWGGGGGGGATKTIIDLSMTVWLYTS
jgi:hypothetical protein